MTHSLLKGCHVGFSTQEGENPYPTGVLFPGIPQNGFYVFFLYMVALLTYSC